MLRAYRNNVPEIYYFNHCLSGTKVDHAKAFGRVAFSCPSSQLPHIEASVKEAGETILTPLVSLDTPGKATVQVVILADPVSYAYKIKYYVIIPELFKGWP